MPLLQFKDWLIEEEDSSDSNAANYLRVLKLFCNSIGKKNLKEITRQDVIEFLDKRKKSTDADPEKRWARTWNDYLARLVGFYRWLYNYDTAKQDSILP